MPHIHEKIDFTASVFIVHTDAVLLRMHEKYGKWIQPGGHVELDEDPNEAVIREAKEETGIDIVLVGTIPNVPSEEKGIIGGFKNLLPPQFFNIHKITPESTHRHCDFIYFATSSSRELNPREEEKDNAMRWFTRAELDDPAFDLYPSTIFYAKAALDTLAES